MWLIFSFAEIILFNLVFTGRARILLLVPVSFVKVFADPTLMFCCVRPMHFTDACLIEWGLMRIRSIAHANNVIAFPRIRNSYMASAMGGRC